MNGDRSILLPGHPVPATSANLARLAATAALGLFGAASLTVFSRRLAGALATSLETPTLLVAGLLVAMVAAAIRLGWFMPTAENHSRRLDRVVMAAISAAVAALGVGLCLPAAPTVGLVMFCTLLAVEETGAWVWYARRRAESTSPRLKRVARLDTAHASVSHPGRGSRPYHAISAFDPELACFPENVTQQLTRSQAADGTEELSGWLRMPFVAGQRTSNVHVAFCPPFAATPVLEVEQSDGPEARIRTAQLLPYGARLDLKLAAAAEEPTAVLLQFSARTTRDKA